MTRTYLDTLHPSFSLVYFVAVLIFTMSATHPALLAISLTTSIVFGIWLRGGLSVLKSFAWQLPLLIIIVVVNPLFSSTGTVELFRIGTQAIYFESVANAVYMGCMLIAVMQWFSNANCVIGSEELMGTVGKKLPIISLMITMVGRLIPRFIQRGNAIEASLSACTAAYPQAAEQIKTAANTPQQKQPKQKNRIQNSLRTITTLMSWSMEDSLESADSMKARGWGACPQRTAYERYRFSISDAILLTVLVILIALNSVITIGLCSQFGFFPSIHGTILSPALFPYTLLFLLPLLLESFSLLRRKVCS